MKITFLFLLLVFQLSVARAKSPADSIIYPEAGKPMPDFTLKNMEFYPQAQVNLSSFKGKWLILNLWDRYCGGCISLFPRYDEIQRKIGDKIQFVLVGRPDGTEATQLIYRKYHDQYNFILPCAFDLDFFNRFDINSSPYMIIVDPNGIVKAITSFLTLRNVQDLLSGKKPELQRVYRQHESHGEIKYDPDLPFLTHDNGGNDSSFLYRCLVAKYNPEMNIVLHGKIKDSLIANAPKGPITEEEAAAFNSTTGRRFEVIGASLNNLFCYAYLGKLVFPHFGDSLYGKIWPQFDIQVSDTAQFQVDGFPSSKNRYCFSLMLPFDLDTRENRMQVMQRELLNYFGLYAELTERKMPYWRLVSTDEAKVRLKSKGGSSAVVAKGNKFQIIVSIRNLPVSDLIFRHIPSTLLPIVDETGIQGNIDIDLDIPKMFPSIDDVKIALEKNGLDLIEGQRNIKVLVIRDGPLKSVVNN